MSIEDDDEMIIPAPGTPAYWDLVYVHSEVYADGHITVNLPAVLHAVQNIGGLYHSRGIGDLSAMFLARVRLIDNTTPGRDLVEQARERVAIFRCDGDEEAVNITSKPYQIAALDQVAPVMAEALDQDHCDARSIALHLRKKMDGSPEVHYTALVSLAGGLLTRTRMNALDAAEKDSSDS
ncbi:hypothetical protein [Streptomyces violaceusniger]|uniref:Uncharacterized protein n=1 Tax=Streptomyces violaceusniger (strain Tu 4113) TaxID=653045 RepID=G2PHX7_STRV4|nr:hypothetical protein [Streptomyces violaceusniger]AEM88928.1 hypothetical protein Strvi_0153 [Streptomyces violaceusniger Tu 4113]